MVITQQGSNYRILFKYNPTLIERVKELPERKFDPVNKCWTVPIRFKVEVEKFAFRYNFQMGDKVVNEENYFDIPPMPELSVDIPLKMKLFPYQATGVAYNLIHNRVIIGDKPGLGKTCQAIATVIAKNAFPCLVICPSSLKINWQREWQKWSDKKAVILTDSIKKNFPLFWSAGLTQVFIVNYESLKKYFVEYIDPPKMGPNGKPVKMRLNNVHFKAHNIGMFKSVVIDEIHRVKDASTQQAKFTKGISHGKETILGLTGTPVINKPKDLISQLGIIDQMDAFGGYKNFNMRYCSGPNEASNLRELNYKLNLSCFYQREKKDVLKDLPAKMRQIILCEISTRREYQDAENSLVDYLKKYKDADDQKIARALRGEIMVMIGILKNISARGKLADVCEFVDDILESGEKLVLFCHLKDVINALKLKYPKAVTITGDDSSDSRQHAVDSFQNNPKTQLIICSIKAAGVGLTLTASSHVAFVELPWTAADTDQCEDRCHRIGQLESVMASYFLGENTIDEKIYKIIQAKREMASIITGDTEQIEEDIVSMVANLFNAKEVES